MNTQEFANIVDSGSNHEVQQIVTNYSLPMFMLNRIINRKGLTNETKEIAKQDKIERIECELSEIELLD